MTPNRKSYFMSYALNVGQYFVAAQQAGAAIEFALSGLALFIFLMAALIRRQA
jgi:hypothetical protein